MANVSHGPAAPADTSVTTPSFVMLISRMFAFLVLLTYIILEKRGPLSVYV